MMERAMGIIIMVVAVFDIHMERKAVANMNPISILPGLMPKNIKTLIAMRLCKFHRSMARAIKKPPKNRKIKWLKYIAEMVFPSTTPNNGKSTTGSSAVAASGMASVIHQIAINIAIASV